MPPSPAALPQWPGFLVPTGHEHRHLYAPAHPFAAGQPRRVRTGAEPHLLSGIVGSLLSHSREPQTVRRPWHSAGPANLSP